MPPGTFLPEDLVYMLQRMGAVAGVSLPTLIETARWMESSIERRLPGMLMRCGSFPPAGETVLR